MSPAGLVGISNAGWRRGRVSGWVGCCWAAGPVAGCGLRDVGWVAFGAMTRVLITGMSGTGKSALLEELSARGYSTVDTDYGDYYEVVGGERLWRGDRIEALSGAARGDGTGGLDVLFVQGTARNQGRSIRGLSTSCC
jgi:hypothetical protein